MDQTTKNKPNGKKSICEIIEDGKNTIVRIGTTDVIIQSDGTVAFMTNYCKDSM